MAIKYFIKEKFYPEEPPIKIGEDKSMTWCFGLYVYKKHVIHTLQDWIPIFSHSSRIIIDQFNTLYTPDLMINIITKRGFSEPLVHPLFNYDDNNVILGPNNLIRRKVGYHNCVAHGEGTWDYIDALI